MRGISIAIGVALVGLASSASVRVEDGGPTPVVMWHGMGDTCCNPLSLGSIQKFIEREIPGVYVHSLKFGKTFVQDEESGFLTPVNKQVEMACEAIANDEKLRNGYNSVGFSQGGQFLRAVAQRCPNPPMKNLVSVGGQHQGVFGIPQCEKLPKMFSFLCNLGREAINAIIYTDLIQSHLVQAQYWHDPLHHDKYVQKSQFIAEINNEGPNPNATYATNLKKLNKLALVMFEEDSMVEPRESSHFKYYKDGQGNEIVDFGDSTLGLKDTLKEMKDAGQIDYLSTPGDHLQFTTTWFKANVINRYLKN